MNIDINMLNCNILVSEITEEILVNGVMTIYDSESPYMFCKIIKMSDEARKELNLLDNDILVIKRYAKEEFISGLYFISWKDVRCKISEDDFKNVLSEGITF